MVGPTLTLGQHADRDRGELITMLAQPSCASWAGGISVLYTHTHSAIAAHFCRFISASVGAKFRRFLKYFVFVNDSLSLSNLSAASRAVAARVLGRSDLSVAGRVSMGFGCLLS